MSASRLGPAVVFIGDAPPMIAHHSQITFTSNWHGDSKVAAIPVSFHATMEFRIESRFVHRLRTVSRRITDRRRYNRARRKAVRAILEGISRG